MQDVTTVRASWIRRNPWMTALSCIPWLLAAAFVLATLITGVPLAFAAPHLAFIGLVLFVSVWQQRPRARKQFVEVTVDEDVVRIGNASIRRSRIDGAEMIPTMAGTVVVVRCKDTFDRELVVEDDATGHALLTALGFDASQRTARYRTRSLALVRYPILPIVLVGLLATFVISATLALPWLVPLFLVALLALVLKRGSVVVGADGVLVRWLWIRDFIAIRDIVETRRFDDAPLGRQRVSGLELVTDDRDVKLPLDVDDMMMVRQRIDDVVTLARASRVDDEASLLARRDEPLREWVARLKIIGVGAGATLRTAAVMPDQLWRIASDPTQPADARAAAGIALSPMLGAAGRAKLASLATATAEPKLRVALERVAGEADDDELETALAELETARTPR